MRPILSTLLLAATLVPLSACGLKANAVVLPGRRPLAPLVAHAVEGGFAGGEVIGSGTIEQSFSVTTAGEGLLDLTASVPGGDWELAGREAATLRLYLDGQYNQDVVIATGEAAHVFSLFLGAVAPGSHVLRFERVAPASAPGLTQIRVGTGAVSVVPPSAADYAVYAQAPIIFGRPESFHTDAPVTVFHDLRQRSDGGTITRYTTMFTNEDGGTPTRELFARWGRTVDIDWSYAVECDPKGRVDRETYQGKLHITHAFKGRREGRHPFLRVSTANNCYDDEGDSPLRFRMSPALRLDPAATAREEMLDQVPWAYALMAKELFREGKATKDFFNPPALDRPAAVGDPKRFLFVEFRLDYQGRGVAVAAKLKGYDQPFTSHRGDGDLCVTRSGWVRAAIELPRAIEPKDLERLELLGVGRGTALVTGVRRVLVLDDSYLPVQFPISWEGEVALRKETDRALVYEAKSAPEPMPGPESAPKLRS